ncbi:MULTISPECIES: hypothetical protein [Pseudonocardia]|uniref:Uncharacterized protein n=2 Tax=Pseudonocardia TaxID=1847 RepID=A0A1Y2N1W9_PSEAH|nr:MULTISPECIES: hypothetical protein [Pseudonocardia]OSY41466.1 hypothetical protein BG845_01957 [Pseudonocardia autotrophica]TDN71423.1 hypothetical protein C8E95_0453 [Pseudonocardia autotrophica]BBG02098.1 hypothetical protein Pdca_33070 [Pseudonocardia autotrophica]GEC24112.1 hypothetical protein PSA01_11410 [Pseudonocardia saturnea]
MNGFVLTWIVFGVMLALFAARAWVVESNRGRLTTAGSAQRGLTAAVAGSVVVLVVMLTFNGGVTLVDLLINGEAELTTPADAATGGAGPGEAPVDPAAPPAADPAAPPAADPPPAP